MGSWCSNYRSVLLRDVREYFVSPSDWAFCQEIIRTRQSSCGKSYDPQHNLFKHKLTLGMGGTPSCPGQEVPHPVLAVWYPKLFWLGNIQGYPHLGRGHPFPPGTAIPPGRMWDQCMYYGVEMGYPSRKGHGPVEVLWDRDGVLPRCELTNKLKTLPTVILRMREVINMVWCIQYRDDCLVHMWYHVDIPHIWIKHENWNHEDTGHGTHAVRIKPQHHDPRNVGQSFSVVAQRWQCWQ